MEAAPTPGLGRRADVLLSVRDLAVTFGLRGHKAVTAVDEVSFDIRPGQHVGLVGESGSGKSVTALAIMGLLPKRGVEVGGTVDYAGRNLLATRQQDMAKLRGRDIAMVFQDPMSSLNPVVTVGIQLEEVIRRHENVDKREARDRAEAPAAAGGDPRSRSAPAGVPAPALGRDAAAGADRHRAGLWAQAADRRRTHHRARRDDPGAGPGGAEGAGRRDRRGAADDHPRPRRGRGSVRRGQRHVRRPDRRVDHARPAVRRTAPPLHRRAPRECSPARLTSRDPAAADPGVADTDDPVDRADVPSRRGAATRSTGARRPAPRWRSCPIGGCGASTRCRPTPTEEEA